LCIYRNVTAPVQTNTRAINVIAVAAGVWFIMSPAAFGLIPWDHSHWNNVVTGTLVVAAGIAGIISGRCISPTRWLIAILGAWIAISPWIFGYADDWDQLLNTLAVGVVLLVAVARCGPAAAPSRR
jgi:site-specific recombinase